MHILNVLLSLGVASPSWKRFPNQNSQVRKLFYWGIKTPFYICHEVYISHGNMIGKCYYIKKA